MPTAWLRAFIVPIEKRGADLSQPANWRVISLQSHTKKLFEACVRLLLKKRGWTGVHELQTGFQRKTGALEAVYVVDELTTKYALMRKPLNMVLLDVRKAYDRTPRALVWRKLRSRGAPQHVIGVLQALLDRCRVAIRVGTEISADVAVEVGVPQGDVLSPDLFNVLVDGLPERLRRACEPFDCPRIGLVRIPVIMYADDQSLLHWNQEALQAMLIVAHEYMAEHKIMYTVAKSHVVRARPDPTAAPLLLDGTAIPDVESAKLLGVRVAFGRIDHRAQLTERLQSGLSAMLGLDRLGAFTNGFMTLAQKRLLLTAYGRSRVEYGMAICRHDTSALASVDQLFRRFLGRCIGGGRGTILSMRLAGITPAEARQAQLRFNFDTHLRFEPCLDEPDLVPSLAQRVRESCIRSKTSCIVNMFSRCRFEAFMQTRFRAYADDHRAHHGMTVSAADDLRLLRRGAQRAALEELSWSPADNRLKLMRLQTQGAHAPHPAAYLAGVNFATTLRWVTNLIPGARYPCRNCEGRFHVSRYHLTRCSHVIRILGSRYNWRAHARFADQTDNVLDAMFMDLVPENATTEYIRRRLRRCPTVPTTKARPEPSLPIYEDTGRQWMAEDIGIAVAYMNTQCCVLDTVESRCAGNGEASDSGDQGGDEGPVEREDELEAQDEDGAADNRGVYGTDEDSGDHGTVPHPGPGPPAPGEDGRRGRGHGRFRGPGGMNGIRHGRGRPRVSVRASRCRDQVNITSCFHRRCGATESGEEDATGAAVKRRRSRSPDRRGNGDECRESMMATEMFRGGCVPQNAETNGHHQGGHDGDDDGGHDDSDDHDDGDHDDGGAHDNGADYDDDGNRDNDVDDCNCDQGDDCNRDSGNNDDGRGDDGDDDPVHDADALDDGPITVPPTMPMKPVTAEPPAATTPSILIVMNRRRTQPAGSAEPPYAPVARVPTAASPITMAQLTTAIRRRPRRAIGDPNSDIVDEAAQRRKRPRHDAALRGADGGPSGSVFVLPRPALEHCNDLAASPTTSRLDDLHDRRRPSAAPTKTTGGPALVAPIVGGAYLLALPTPQLPRAVRGRQRRGRARGADALARPNVSNADATSTGTPTTHPSAGSSRSADPATPRPSSHPRGRSRTRAAARVHAPVPTIGHGHAPGSRLLNADIRQFFSRRPERASQPQPPGHPLP